MVKKSPVIRSLNIRNFRNFESRDLTFSKKFNILIGANGVGKTNILEAISLLSPGKGLRNCKLEELHINDKKISYNNGWSLKFSLDDAGTINEIVTSKEIAKKNRNILIDSKLCKNQAELAKILNIVWLTPRHDSLFVDASSDRRRFFDRLIFNLYPDHMKALSKYDYYVKERMKILLNNSNATSWLDKVEAEIVNLISSIAFSRNEVIKYLNHEISEMQTEFPKAEIHVNGYFEKYFDETKDAALFEKQALNIFKENRKKDREDFKTNAGIHRSDFDCYYLSKNQHAKYSSTGEQKSLLICLIIAQAKLYAKLNNKFPIILLDEVFSHLDKNNRSYLINELDSLNSQIFLTGTEESHFRIIKGDVDFFKL